MISCRFGMSERQVSGYGEFEGLDQEAIADLPDAIVRSGVPYLSNDMCMLLQDLTVEC
jgi:hypothetical protein